MVLTNLESRSNLIVTRNSVQILFFCIFLPTEQMDTNVEPMRMTSEDLQNTDSNTMLPSYDDAIEEQIENKNIVSNNSKSDDTVTETAKPSVDVITMDTHKAVIMDDNNFENINLDSPKCENALCSNGILPDEKSENEHNRQSRVYRIKRSVDLAFSPILTSNNPLPEYATFWQKLKYGLMLPPHGTFAHYLQLGIIVLQIWAVLVALTKSEALPGGNFFSLIVLLVLCHFCSLLFVFIRLPPLVGK